MTAYLIDLRPKDLPRSTTRAEWATVHRWLRLVRAAIDKRMAREYEALLDALAYGSAQVKRDAMDEIAYPPVRVISPPPVLIKCSKIATEQLVDQARTPKEGE